MSKTDIDLAPKPTHPGWGGRRPNQTGRPRIDDAVRRTIIFLVPADRDWIKSLTPDQVREVIARAKRRWKRQHPENPRTENGPGSDGD